jgi:hypothetical protein
MSRLFSRRSFHKVKPGETGYKSPTATQFRILRGKRAGEIVSNAERVRLTKGAHPTKLAAEHKAGARAYVSAAAEAQAAKQIKYRQARREQFGAPQYHGVPTHSIAYLNTAGHIAHDYFSGKNLMTMHLYRDAYDRAIYTGDGSELAKFRDRVIVTYRGPGLPNYHNKGAIVFPETNLKKILKHRDGMTARQRLQFDADRNYRHRLEEAA